MVVLAALGRIPASAQERPAKSGSVLSIEESVSSLAFAADGKVLACGLVVRELSTGKEVGRGKVGMGSSAEGTQGPAESTYAVYSPDGRQFASVHFDTHLTTARHAICLWNVTKERDLRLAKTLLFVKERGRRYREPLCYLAFSPDGKMLATRHPDDATVVWETASGKERLRLDTQGLAVGFALDGRTLISVSRDGLVEHWDLATKKRSGSKNSGNREDFFFVNQAVASADGKTLALADDYSVVLKDALSGKSLRRFDDVDPGCLALSPTGEMLAVRSREDVIIFGAGTGKELARLHEPEKSIGTIAFSPDAKHLAVGGSAGVWVWPLDKLANVRNGKARRKPAVPLEARLTSRNATYTLDLGGRTPEEFARQITRGSLLPSPKVDLVLTLRNTGDKKLVLDPDVRVDVYLIGNAAMNHPEGSHSVGVQFEDLPKKVSLAPGETYSVSIKSLDQGPGRQSYWLLPGEYALHAKAWVFVDAESEGKPKFTDGSVFADLPVPPLRVKVVAEKK